MVEMRVAHVNDASNKIKINFLIQNISFSANFSKILKNTQYISKHDLDTSKSTRLHREIFFDDEKINNICDKIRKFNFFKYLLHNSPYKNNNRFPANIIKCEFNRDSDALTRFKSFASIKRQLACNEIKKRDRKKIKIENLFETQKCSFSVFSNGLVNSSGASCKEDAKRILSVLRLFNSFLP